MMTTTTENPRYEAVLLLSFGGPEGHDDVMPFLENVVRGRNIPRERLLEVAEHYHHFGGVSPINGQNRALIAALQVELEAHGLALPIYFGNRNWHPMVEDTVRQMAADGVRRALALATSAYGGYSGCRQYLNDLERAREAVGAHAPVIDKVRLYYNHPGFIEANAARVLDAFDVIAPSRRAAAHLTFTAHSIPLSMAQGSRYVQQLEEACRLVAAAVGSEQWKLVWQSRSGPPQIPWLEPDICDHLRAIAARGVTDVVVSPIGFVSDHMEVLYDLDTEAMSVAAEAGLQLVRAGTAGTHAAFVRMARQLIAERVTGALPEALGADGPSPDACPAGCCPAGQRPTVRTAP